MAVGVCIFFCSFVHVDLRSSCDYRMLMLFDTLNCHVTDGGCLTPVV